MGFFDSIKRALGVGSGAVGEPSPEAQIPAGALALREGSVKMNLFMVAASLDAFDRDGADEGEGTGSAHDHSHDHDEGQDHSACEDHLAHGMGHLAELLAADPANADYLAYLDEFVRRAEGDLARLMPEGEERYASVEALRAYFLVKGGDVEQGLDLLSMVVHAKPEANYLEAWALDWLEAPDVLNGLSGELATRLLTLSLMRYPEYCALPIRREADCLRWARLAAAWDREALPAELQQPADMTAIGLQRKAGRFEEGLALLKEVQATRPSWHGAVAEGLILRESGQAPEADAAFRGALELDPSDLSARLEAGDMYVRREEWDQALAWYQEVLEVEPEHPWAEPSALWCTWRRDSPADSPDETFPPRLVELLQGGNQRARMVFGRFIPYVGYLPGPKDATAHILFQILEQPESVTGSLDLDLSDIESPSNAVAFALAARLVGADFWLNPTYGNIAKPDPREPVAETRFQLWKREGEILVGALEEPAADVAQAVLELAERPFDSEVNWAEAGRLAQRLGTAAVPDLLACFVHPPGSPPLESVLDWVVRVQCTLAQVLAQIDSGWEGSARKDALLSLLHGPRDWSTEAAILALTDLVREEPLLSAEVSDAFRALDEATPNSGGWGYLDALYDCWLGFPHLFPDEVDAIAAKAAALKE